jgi:hypothetical protein
MGKERHVTHMNEKGSVYKAFVGKPEEITWGFIDVNGSLMLTYAPAVAKTAVAMRNCGLLFVDAVGIPSSKSDLS